jgi:hypothetical protein
LPARSGPIATMTAASTDMSAKANIMMARRAATMRLRPSAVAASAAERSVGFDPLPWRRGSEPCRFSP